MKQSLVLLILMFGWSSGELCSPKTQKKRELPPGTSEQVETSHTFDTQYTEGNQYGNKQLREVTITKNVPVPYPVKVEKHIAIPVKIPFPVAVHNKIPIYVERKIPIYVEKPVPVQVDRPFPYPLPIEVPVFHKVAVEVPKPYPVHVPKPYPVYIQRPAFVENSKGNRIKKHVMKGLKRKQ
ncbi:mantle protein-like [Toxorhynchites rutilus septentrionalis]|uniref:mantle protein-like n=1 Tax=Toxorhynchites rutilus septentrionalis TaxID=329112 RepID=UPI0024792672|nr:mantle protein-like [Toxorhynchites rutilus septentrionalis]